MNLLKKENNPCYGCTDRKAMCHIGCKNYKGFKENLQKQKEKSYAANRGRYEAYEYNKEKYDRLTSRKERCR